MEMPGVRDQDVEAAETLGDAASIAASAAARVGDVELEDLGLAALRDDGVGDLARRRLALDVVRSRRARRARRAPRQHARPMPREPPVTRPTLPLSSNMVPTAGGPGVPCELGARTVFFGVRRELRAVQEIPHPG